MEGDRLLSHCTSPWRVGLEFGTIRLRHPPPKKTPNLQRLTVLTWRSLPFLVRCFDPCICSSLSRQEAMNGGRDWIASLGSGGLSPSSRSVPMRFMNGSRPPYSLSPYVC